MDPSATDWADAFERASTIRDARWGRVITYSRKVFIPLTTLCRDSCGYCIFAKTPAQGGRFLEPGEVLAIAEAGRSAGCKEALFSLGERPEMRYAEAREALAGFGHRTTVEYLAAMCGRVADETGLIPHVNGGALSKNELRVLADVSASMGMMIENVSPRFMKEGMAHFRCPDKYPRRRFATLRAAGELGVPFTTGILIGLGETWAERVEALQAIEEAHGRYGNIQEVIIQNFRTKKGIPMEGRPDATHEEMMKTIAAARLTLSPEISLQAPPNLMPDEYREYIGAGLNDWGGISPVTLDHINPERQWPKIAELAAATASKGYELRERLTVYPRYIAAAERHLSPRMQKLVLPMVESAGLPKEQRLS